MAKTSTDKYSAGEQGLGYIYQARFALLYLLQLPENTTVFFEKDDDLDFLDINGNKSLASLKHKAINDRLTDLSTDFWKSVRIWLARYKRDDRSSSNLRFFLFTTGTISDDSFLKRFRPSHYGVATDPNSLSELAETTLGRSKSALIREITREFHELNNAEKQDFLGKV